MVGLNLFFLIDNFVLFMIFFFVGVIFDIIVRLLIKFGVLVLNIVKFCVFFIDCIKIVFFIFWLKFIYCKRFGYFKMSFLYMFCVKLFFNLCVLFFCDVIMSLC